MDDFLTRLEEKRTGNLIAIFIIILFLLLPLIRLYPYTNTLELILLDRDDWCRYAQFALDIKHNGIFMPSLAENYNTPAGFLYCYFVAFCFYLFGDHTIPVFIIQNFLLGLSVALIYKTFRDKMKPLTGLAFLIVLFVFSLLDVHKYYTYRLLSENLALFTMSAFFYCFIKGREKNSLSLLLTSAVLLGISILTRPNIFPFSVLLMIFLLVDTFKKRAGLLRLVLFIFLLALTMSFLGIRNHYITGDWNFLPTVGVSLVGFTYTEPDYIAHFFKKTIFCFGILTPLDSNFQWRPHWIIMWVGYFIYLFYKIRNKLKPESWEITCHLYIVSYYTFLILIAQVESYGFRMLIPATFIVLAFPFIAWDRINSRVSH